MALPELATYMFIGGGGSAVAAYGTVWLSNLADKIRRKKVATREEAEKTDGRSPKEWFDILRDMGREEYEKLSRGALDGLEESDKYGKWDIKPLLKDFYGQLMAEWYPEKFCKYCYRQNCNQQCDAYWAGLPPCKICKRIRTNLTCPQCNYYDPVRLHAKSERVKIPVQNHIPAPPPRAAITTPDTKNDIKILMVSQPGTSERMYRIARNGTVWTADKTIIETFQRTKGLIPSGLVDEKTRNAIIRYLDAGNPWPISPPRKNLTTSELERVNRDLAKWKKAYEGELNW